MPIEFGDVLTGQIFIDGESGPIGWTGIQTISTLLDDDIFEEEDKNNKWIDFDELRNPITFTANMHLSEKLKRLLIFGWKAKGPYRKRLIKKMENTFPWHNFTFELGDDEA
jgi:hypothetical protein